MPTLTVQNLVDAGTKPNMALDTPATTLNRADIGTGYNTFLRVVNAAGSSMTVTVLGAGTTSYAVAKPPNGPITVAATTGEAWIPLRKEYDQGDGLGANISLSSTTSVTVALVRLS